MIYKDMEMEVILKKSDDKNEAGEEMCYYIFTAKDALEAYMKFKDKSYLYVGQTVTAVISHVINFDAEKTFVRVPGKAPMALILGTHVYLSVSNAKYRFRDIAEIMGDMDNWIEIPNHDATKGTFVKKINKLEGK